MKQAMQAAGATAKFGCGAGLSILFISTCDDMIYTNFRKNVIMPFQMVRVKGASLQTSDVKELSAGTADFLRDMKPHALHRSSAKELILKDADYSTPQDHYFNYLGQKKTMYD